MEIVRSGVEKARVLLSNLQFYHITSVITSPSVTYQVIQGPKKLAGSREWWSNTHS